MKQHHRHSLKVDAEGRVLVLIQGGVAWVVDKVGQYHALANAAEVLSRHLDLLTDPHLNVGTGASEPGWKQAH